MKQIAIAIAAAAIAVVSPRAVEASCAAPELDVVWSYPADGQTDVPTNAQGIVLTTLGRWAKVTLDGVELAAFGDRGYRFTTPTLSADTEHTLVVTSAHSTREITLRFRTGSGPAASHPPAAETSGIVDEGKPNLSERCEAVIAASDCYDTGQDEYLTLRTSQKPIAWLVTFSGDEHLRGVDLWPAECGSPVVYVHSSDDRCYELTAVNEIGETTEAGRYCHGPFSISGCASASGPAIPLAAALAALALGASRRRSRAG